MSALGHKRTFRSAIAMSALAPIADIRSVRLAFLNFKLTQAPDYVGPASREGTSRHYRRS